VDDLLVLPLEAPLFYANADDALAP